MPNSLTLLADIGVDLTPADPDLGRLLAIVEQVEREARRMRLEIWGYPTWRDGGHTDGCGMIIIAAHVACQEGRDIHQFVADYGRGVVCKAMLLLAGLDPDRPDVVDVYLPPLPDYHQ
jgi:hypothetical protein